MEYWANGEAFRGSAGILPAAIGSLRLLSHVPALQFAIPFQREVQLSGRMPAQGGQHARAPLRDLTI